MLDGAFGQKEKMIQEKINNYMLIIDDDETYSENSSDNKINYLNPYKSKEDERSVSKHSIIVKNVNEEIIASTILIGTGGATGIHNKSYYIQNNQSKIVRPLVL